MSHPETHTATLEIPEEHFEPFRLAALEELGEDAEWIRDQAEEAQRKGEDVARYLIDREGGPFRYTETTAALLHELFAGHREVTCRTGVLAHVAEAIARQAREKIGKTVPYSPVSGQDVEREAKIAASLTWALQTAARFHGEYATACAARHGEAA